MPGEHLLVIDDSPTVLKVVEIALTKAGYRVDVAADGDSGLALVRERSTVPDLILLDGMIPDSDSAEICRRLAGDRALARVPVVVMATKSDDLAARFAKAPNVVDYISKPFSPEALQAVVSHVVAGRTSKAQSDGGGSGAAAVDQALSRSRGSEGELLAEGDALAGDLAIISLAQVLELLAEQAHTGLLRVGNGRTGARVEICFRDGRIDLASATGVAEEFLIGRFAVDAGHVAPQALAEVIEARAGATAGGTPPLLGADLVARGLLAPGQLAQVLARQTGELSYEALRWTDGRFHFRRSAAAGLPAPARDAALALNVDRLLLEGFRRVDEWRVIEQEIASFDEVYVRNEHKIADLPRGTFTREELAVLEQVNGRNSVREIVRALRMGSFDVSKVLFRLLRAKLVRRRVSPTVS